MYPALQSTQVLSSVAPMLAEYFPAAQFVHVALEIALVAADHVPVPHCVQSTNLV
jgi:hypothetical protein